VARGPHPADRRAALVGFTAAGRAAVTSLDEARQRLADFLFDEVPADDLARFAAVLDHCSPGCLARISAASASRRSAATARPRRAGGVMRGRRGHDRDCPARATVGAAR
jgi:hypothetical protein